MGIGSTALWRLPSSPIFSLGASCAYIGIQALIAAADSSYQFFYQIHYSRRSLHTYSRLSSGPLSNTDLRLAF